MTDAERQAESDRCRDEAFKALNDRTWGEGKWIRCPTCPHDAEDREVYHHRNAHADSSADLRRQMDGE